MRQRRLGAELRRLRESAGHTAEELATHLGWSSSKVSRIENARIGVRVPDVQRLLELYMIEGRHLGEILALARAATQRGWWDGYQDALPKELASFVALEDEASSAINYSTYVIPGLLQTKEYAHRVIESGSAAFGSLTPRGIDLRVRARMKRQRILQVEEPLRFSTLLDESVLMRFIDSRETMRGQLDRLIELAQLPNVEIGVIPLDVPRQPVFGESFTLLEFRPAYDITFPDILYIDNVHSAEFQEDSITYSYRLSWERLKESALSPADSVALISRLARGF